MGGAPRRETDMRTLLALAPLLLSVLFLQLGSGVLSPLDALAGKAAGFSNAEIGLLGSAHFVGFIFGCVFGPALIARSGHARAFSITAALGVIGALLHPLIVDAWVWMGLRAASGFGVALGYTVIESWLHASLENRNRGRMLSSYRIVDLGGAVVSQLMLAQLPPAEYVAYSVVAILGAISLLPLALSTAPQPDPPKVLRVRFLRALALSPLGVAGVFVVGLTNSSFRMVGAIYGVERGLSREEIGYFLAAAMLGGAAAQAPMGWLADKFDRRLVLIGVSAAALAVCLTLGGGLAPESAWGLIGGSFLFGAAAMPVYSISTAYANDYCPRDFVVELNASLLLCFAAGAVFSPYAAALLIEAYGPDALWLFIAVSHSGLVAFGLYRMTRRASPEPQAGYGYTPRTSLVLGRLLKAARGDSEKPPRADPPD